MEARLIPVKCVAICFLCVFVFFAAAGVSHATSSQPAADPPLSAETAHPAVCALQAEDCGTNVDGDDDFARPRKVWPHSQDPLAGWHLRAHRSPFFKSVEMLVLLPRPPPVAL